MTKEEYLELKAAFRSEIETLEEEIRALQQEIENVAEDKVDQME